MTGKAKMGAPTKYSKELADKICKLIATNPVGLTTLIKLHNLPDRQTIYNWLNLYGDFFDNYMQAKKQQAHVIADEMLEVHNDIPTYFDKDGNEKIDNGMLGRAKLKMEALRWSAARLNPKWYSEKTVNTDDGKDDEMDKDLEERRKELDQEYKREC